MRDWQELLLQLTNYCFSVIPCDYKISKDGRPTLGGTLARARDSGESGRCKAAELRSRMFRRIPICWQRNDWNVLTGSPLPRGAFRYRTMTIHLRDCRFIGCAANILPCSSGHTLFLPFLIVRISAWGRVLDYLKQMFALDNNWNLRLFVILYDF